MYAALFWGGYVLLGSLLPLALLLHLRSGRALAASAGLVLLGAFAWLYAFIIGGQAYPLELLPGRALRSSFGDGVAAAYVPSLPELLLGAGGVGAALLLTAIGLPVRHAAARPLVAKG